MFFRNIVNLFIFFLFSRSVSVNVNVEKGITHTLPLQSNTTLLELWIIFPVTFLFLLVWCKQKSDKKLKNFLLFLKRMTFLFLKNKNSSDFFDDVRTCTRSEFFCVWVHEYLWWFSIFDCSNDEHFLFCF